jgi:uncharacterized protein (TIGR02285 family)
LIFSFNITSTFSAEITWLFSDFPPYYIINGNNKDEGRDQQLIKLINEYLPNDQFYWKRFPTSRTITEISNPDNKYCVMSLFKNTERSKNMIFSKHFSTISFTPKVFIRSDSYYQLSDTQSQSNRLNNSFSLNELLDKYQLGLGITKGRSYGIELDKIIKKSKYKEQIFYRSGIGVSSSLLKMLSKNRVQMVLGYVEEFKYTIDKLKIKDEFITLSVDESDDHAIGYVGCSRNAWGKNAIMRIDKALHILYQNNRASQALKYWLPSNMHQYMEQLITSARLSIR